MQQLTFYFVDKSSYLIQNKIRPHLLGTSTYLQQESNDGLRGGCQRGEKPAELEISIIDPRYGHLYRNH